VTEPDRLGRRTIKDTLRDDQGADQTLQNLLRAVSLNLELRARYRVFEFEASQDGRPEIAQLFRDLRSVESEQITSLMAKLYSRLGEMDLPAPG
jgi:rubrerythrin